MRIHSYKDLVVWQKSVDLVVKIYKICDHLPKSEVYVLASQMKRSAISIPSNIAEGRRRGHRKEFKQFVLVAYGSGGELETQLEIMERLFPDIAIQDAKDLLDSVMRMLNGMIQKLNEQQDSNQLTS